MVLWMRFLLLLGSQTFFRRIFGEGALSTAISQYLVTTKTIKKKKMLKSLLDPLLTTLAIILLIISIIGVLIAPILIY